MGCWPRLPMRCWRWTRRPERLRERPGRAALRLVRVTTLVGRRRTPGAGAVRRRASRAARRLRRAADVAADGGRPRAVGTPKGRVGVPRRDQPELLRHGRGEADGGGDPRRDPGPPHGAEVKAVLASAPDAIIGVNVSGNVELVNAQAERLFGGAPTSWSGSPSRSWSRPDPASPRVHRARYLGDHGCGRWERGRLCRHGARTARSSLPRSA